MACSSPSTPSNKKLGMPPRPSDLSASLSQDSWATRACLCKDVALIWEREAATSRCSLEAVHVVHAGAGVVVTAFSTCKCRCCGHCVRYMQLQVLSYVPFRQDACDTRARVQGASVHGARVHRARVPGPGFTGPGLICMPCLKLEANCKLASHAFHTQEGMSG